MAERAIESAGPAVLGVGGRPTMAVHRFGPAPDRKVRVALVNERGRRWYQVVDGTMPVGAFPCVEKLGAFRQERYGLGFADLVEDAAPTRTRSALVVRAAA